MTPGTREESVTAVAIPGAAVALSTASVYPEPTATAFTVGSRLGYDGIEVMVWTDPVSREAGALIALAEHHGLPVVSIHAPTLLLTQRIWGPDPWTKIDRSLDLAHEVGATTVVVHRRLGGKGLRPRVRRRIAREADLGSPSPSRTCSLGGRASADARVRPHWDPVDQPYANVTLDLSHLRQRGRTRSGWSAAR